MNLSEVSHVGSYGFLSCVSWSHCPITVLALYAYLNPNYFCRCYKLPLKTFKVKRHFISYTFPREVCPRACWLASCELAGVGGNYRDLPHCCSPGILFSQFGLMFSIACKFLSFHLFMCVLFPVLSYEVQYFSSFLKEAWTRFLRLWISEKGFSTLILHQKVLNYM